MDRANYVVYRMPRPCGLVSHRVDGVWEISEAGRKWLEEQEGGLDTTRS